MIVRELRLPRTLVGLQVGVALAVADVIMQTLTRNPIAEPRILGISAGASFGVVVGVFMRRIPPWHGRVGSG